MAGWKSKYLGKASGSAPDPNRAKDPQQSSEETNPQQLAQAPHTTSRTRRLLEKFKQGPSPPSPFPGVEQCSSAANQFIVTAVPQSLAAPAIRTPKSYSEVSVQPIHGSTTCDPPQVTASGNVTGSGVTAVPSGTDSPPSSSSLQGPSFVSASIPIASKTPASPSVCAPSTPTSTLQAQSPATTDVHAEIAGLLGTKSTPVPDHSAVLWAQALEIAKNKLSNNNLPLLDLTKLTSQSAEENIAALHTTLKTLQEDEKKKRWSYSWRGKEVIIVERLGEILRSREEYLKIVDNVTQSNQLSALVWAGIRAMMQVSTLYAVLNHQNYTTETTLIPWIGRFGSFRNNRRFRGGYSDTPGEDAFVRVLCRNLLWDCIALAVNSPSEHSRLCTTGILCRYHCVCSQGSNIF